MSSGKLHVTIKPLGNSLNVGQFLCHYQKKKRKKLTNICLKCTKENYNFLKKKKENGKK